MSAEVNSKYVFKVPLHESLSITFSFRVQTSCLQFSGMHHHHHHDHHLGQQLFSLLCSLLLYLSHTLSLALCTLWSFGRPVASQLRDIEVLPKKKESDKVQCRCIRQLVGSLGSAMYLQDTLTAMTTNCHLSALKGTKIDHEWQRVCSNFESIPNSN